MNVAASLTTIDNSSLYRREDLLAYLEAAVGEHLQNKYPSISVEAAAGADAYNRGVSDCAAAIERGLVDFTYNRDQLLPILNRIEGTLCVIETPEVDMPTMAYSDGASDIATALEIATDSSPPARR